MKYSLLSSILVFSALTAQSQTDTVYLDHHYRIKADKKEATYYRFTSFSGLKKENRRLDTFYLSGEKFYEEDAVKTSNGTYKQEGPTRFYYKNGQKKEELLHSGNEVQVTKWHENGQVYYKSQKVDGKAEGEAVGYYPSGQVRRREQFRKGELTTGECFSENGTPIPYYQHASSPQFPNGVGSLLKLISTSFRIPSEAIRSGVSGVTVVEFLVSKEVNVHDARVIKSIDPAVDEEALRVVNSLPKFTPATEEGQPLEFVYTVPINVTQRNGASPLRNSNNNSFRNR